MTLQYSPKNNPRVIIIQKLYGEYFNKEENLTFPKHRFKKFIKDVVNGTIERDDVIKGETPHFDFISSASTHAIMNLSVESKKPIGNGIITCLNMKQAKARGKKGKEAAQAIISVLSQ